MDWHDTKLQLWLTALGLFVLAVVAFIIANRQEVHVNFFILSMDIPVSLLILGSLFTGVVLMTGVWIVWKLLKK